MTTRLLRHTLPRRAAYALATIAHRIASRLDDALNREAHEAIAHAAFSRDLRRLGIAD
jgi:hypothetical protein